MRRVGHFFHRTGWFAFQFRWEFFRCNQYVIFLGISQRGLMEPDTEPEHVIVDFKLEKAFEPRISRINTDYQRITELMRVNCDEAIFDT